MGAVPHRPAFSSSPLAALAAAFAAGVALARFAAPPLAACIVCGALLSVFSVYALYRKKLALASTTLLAAFVFAGVALALAETKGIAENRVRRFYERGEIASGDPLELTGVLARAPEVVPDGLLVTLRVERLKHRYEERAATGSVELFAPVRDARASDGYAALELRRGARVRVMAALTRAERFRNPGVSSLTEFLEQRDVDARGHVKSHLLFERLDDERVFLPLFALEEWRARLARLFEETFSAETAGVLKAALLGNRHGLSRATAERFREGGTFHVLVISGMHITFVGGVVWFAARRLTRGAARQWLASVAAVWGYAVFVGAEASVVRAALMFTVVALAPVLGRRTHALNALGGAGLLLLVWRPANLFDPSFQLTFLSVLSIVALALPLLQGLKAVGEWRPTRSTPYPPACPRWWGALGEILFWSEKDWRREMARSAHDYRLFKTPLAARLDRWRVQRVLRYVFAATVVSMVVQLTLLPLFVVYFHRLSLAGPLLNILVGGLMVVLSFAALAATALTQSSAAAAAPFVWLAEEANWLMAHSVDPYAA
ncbi:MAG TPA: ComEC/Rec2 family competence protein, partial [Pyrinomonadaceae bacterium]